jgi:hypothetical protein
MLEEFAIQVGQHRSHLTFVAAVVEARQSLNQPSRVGKPVMQVREMVCHIIATWRSDQCPETMVKSVSKTPTVI